MDKNKKRAKCYKLYIFYEAFDTAKSVKIFAKF